MFKPILFKYEDKNTIDVTQDQDPTFSDQILKNNFIVPYLLKEEQPSQCVKFSVTKLTQT